MGGRGASSASRAATVVSVSAQSLDRMLVARANAASVLADDGDRISRKYGRNVAEIYDMPFSSVDKMSALARQKALAENALRAYINNPNPYAIGPARFDVAKTRRGADRAASAEAALGAHMKELRRQQAKLSASMKQKSRAEIIQNALANGELSVVIDGVTWERKTKRSRSFTRVD